MLSVAGNRKEISPVDTSQSAVAEVDYSSYRLYYELKAVCSFHRQPMKAGFSARLIAESCDVKGCFLPNSDIWFCDLRELH